jgi:PEP-CTERM motif
LPLVGPFDRRVDLAAHANRRTGGIITVKTLTRRFAMTAVVFGLIAGTAAQAQAGQLFDFSFSGGGISGSGTLEATSNGDGTYTALSSTGTITGAPDSVSDLNSLVPNPNAPSGVAFEDGISFDNQLLIGLNPVLNENGLMWISNGVYANLYNRSGTYYYLDSVQFSGGNGTGTAVSFTLNPIPEPSTVILGGMACLLGLDLARRRRRKALA